MHLVDETIAYLAANGYEPLGVLQATRRAVVIRATRNRVRFIVEVKQTKQGIEINGAPETLYRERKARAPEPVEDVYDPREEQLRAQRQAIYESAVKKELGLPSSAPFRDSRGRRTDLQLPLDVIEPLVRRYMFATGVGVQKRDDRLRDGGVTAKTIAESRTRYANPDSLLRNRQDYEETLGIVRKNFFRVVPEYTAAGVRFFVWPLRPGALPEIHATREDAESFAATLNSNDDPRFGQGSWWTPRVKKYTQRELSYWLPGSMRKTR